jgi:hypothetical protein
MPVLFPIEFKRLDFALENIKRFHCASLHSNSTFDSISRRDAVVSDIAAKMLRFPVAAIGD